MDELTKEDQRRQWIGTFLSVAIIISTIVVCLVAGRLIFENPRTDDASVRANWIGIAPHVSGPIVELPIRDNQYVEKGELLFVIDPRPYEATLALAEADLAVTDFEIRGRRRAIEAAAAELEKISAQDEYDRQYLARIEPLLAQEFVTANDVAEARTRVAASKAAVRQARQRLDQAIEALGEIDDTNAYRAAAEAAVAQAQLNVGYASVHAPFSGWITNLNLAVGEYANQGQEIFALIDDRVWYVMANFRETFLSSIQPGMQAEVYLMAYPEEKFSGTVQGVGWALYQTNGASVGTLPDVAPTLNWVRLAQRFPVRITLDQRNPKKPFRMGATAVVTVKGFAEETPSDRSNRID
ncbi:MAG: biotin/lipoyl-binding protein [Candidatus Binatia bacterium]|nr:biotin/lipoyl-binding protein [Candidatus Binatia bacterium]MDG2010219.1 biotin/lipoyl-binding protein [Candidatus Binatia bacterium]